MFYEKVCCHLIRQFGLRLSKQLNKNFVSVLIQ